MWRQVRLLLVLVLLGAPGPGHAQGLPIPTRAEDATRKALQKEQEVIVQLLYRERLLRVPPETLHPSRVVETRPVLAVVEDLLFLDLALRLTELGGVENLDRLRQSVAGWRVRAARDAVRSREVLADRLLPTEDELTEALRASVGLSTVLEHPEEKPARQGAAPVPGTPLPASGPALDYIPVSPEDLAALRERYLASGQPVPEAWYARLARDPVAEQRWREQKRASEIEVARLSTAWAMNKDSSYSLGVWLQETWKKRDPFGLAIVIVFLVALAAVAFVLFKLLRRDR